MTAAVESLADVPGQLLQALLVLRRLVHHLARGVDEVELGDCDGDRLDSPRGDRQCHEGARQHRDTEGPSHPSSSFHVAQSP